MLLTITLSLIWTTESLIPSYSRGLSNYQKAYNRKFKNEIRIKMSINDDEGMEINDSKAEDEDENEYGIHRHGQIDIEMWKRILGDALF